jgi:hypothetical protein
MDKTSTKKAIISAIPIEQIEVNKGQVEGLPPNPRLIRDERFELLKKSISDAPEMLSLREVLVVKHGDKYVAVGGNMRFRACKELGFKEIVCKVLPEDTPAVKLREYATKDNENFGNTDWGVLQKWDMAELEQWGMELKKDVKDMTEDEFGKTFNGIKNSDAYYPIVPKFDEKNEVFIIVSDNEVDANYLREVLSMNKMKSYKRGTISKSNIIHIKDVITAINGKNSDTEPQKG